MKKISVILMTLLALVSCQKKFDAIWDELDQHDNRIERLETLCKEMNTNVTALQALVNVLETNDYVKDVVPIVRDGMEIGYTITFTKSEPVTIYHAKDGADGHTPLIGVKADTDGVYYWTLDGQWLLDEGGRKVRATGRDGADGSIGTSPELRIVDGYWEISYDHGGSWKRLDKATGADGADGDSMFSSIDTSDPDLVTFVLADGTSFRVPVKKGMQITFDCESQLVEITPGATVTLAYSLSGASEQAVVTASSDGFYTVKVHQKTATTGDIIVNCPASGADGYINVMVADGDEHYLLRVINFYHGRAEFPRGLTYRVPPAGGVLNVPFLTNTSYLVTIQQPADSWLSVAPQTKVMREEKLSLSAAANTTGADRQANVVLQTEGGTPLVEIKVIQSGKISLELVDLGLKVKWANFNLGAASPYEAGKAMEWGHEEGRDASYPTEMNISGSSYDKVKAQLGGQWRMPTAFDWEELRQKCTWTEEEQFGIKGYTVVGPNGNSIFLPKVNYHTGTARRRESEDYEYVREIKFYNTPVVVEGLYNRPVQGPVRVLPKTTVELVDITSNTAEIEMLITNNAEYNADFLFHFEYLAGMGSIEYEKGENSDTLRAENGRILFKLDGLNSNTSYRGDVLIHLLGDDTFCYDAYTYARLDFTTKNGLGTLKPVPVDLGLSVKWASCNLGASHDEDSGLMLYWGRTDDSWSGALSSQSPVTGTENDIATVTWGQEWRLPTSSELYELMNQTHNFYTSYNNVEGYVFDAKNGSIFLPNNDGPMQAHYMCGTSKYICMHWLYNEYIHIGDYGSYTKNGIRPVYDPRAQLQEVTVSDVTVSSAGFSSELIRLGKGEVTELGFVVGEQTAPVRDGNRVLTVPAKKGAFSSGIQSLRSKTTYHVRAFAVNENGVSYGPEATFTTL